MSGGRVAIVGAYSTPCVAARPDASVQDLAFQGVKGALEDAGIVRASVDEVVICAHDMIDGRGIANMVSAGAAGAYMKAETRATNDGVFGLIIGSLSILAGMADIVLVIGWAKSSEGFDDAVTATEFEPFAQRPVGLTEARALGLQATLLLLRDGRAAREAATAAVVRDRSHGRQNPTAHLREDVTAEQVESSVSVAWPLTELDLPPRSDAACAVVLASEARASEFISQPAWIAGFGWSSEGYALGGRDLSRSVSLKAAASQAYHAARLKSPSSVDIVEYSARSSFQHLVIAEGLGLCEPGAGAAFTLQHRDSSWPLLNPSGGLASSNPYLVAGLASTVSTVKRLRQAGPNSAGSAVIHGSSGPCGQSNAVVVLTVGQDGTN